MKYGPIAPGIQLVRKFHVSLTVEGAGFISVVVVAPTPAEARAIVARLLRIESTAMQCSVSRLNW